MGLRMVVTPSVVAQLLLPIGQGKYQPRLKTRRKQGVGLGTMWREVKLWRLMQQA
jgi:hypothetical protein